MRSLCIRIGWRSSLATKFPRSIMCNHHSRTKASEAIRRLFPHWGFRNLAGNLEPGEFYPDQQAPIVRHGADGAADLVQAQRVSDTASKNGDSI